MRAYPVVIREQTDFDCLCTRTVGCGQDKDNLYIILHLFRVCGQGPNESHILYICM